MALLEKRGITTPMHTDSLLGVQGYLRRVIENIELPSAIAINSLLNTGNPTTLWRFTLSALAIATHPFHPPSRLITAGFAAR